MFSEIYLDVGHTVDNSKQTIYKEASNETIMKIECFYIKIYSELNF